MTDVLLNNIKEFTEDVTGRDCSKVTEDTALEEGLGIYGGDATDYIIAFGKHFKVDVSNFMAGDYFTGEGVPIASIIRAIAGKENKQKKKLLVSHLIKAIKTGRLDEEVINS
jgi:hypothetical protein